MVDQIGPVHRSDMLSSQIPRLPHRDRRIEDFRVREAGSIYPEPLTPGPHGHWKMLLSPLVNLSIIRDLVFFSWKVSLLLMQFTSNFFRLDFSLHLYSNPIPQFFDDDLKTRCMQLVKECFIDQVAILQREVPTEELFSHLSVLRISEEINDHPLYGEECQYALKNALSQLLHRHRQRCEHEMHLWIGQQERLPPYVRNVHEELEEISPDFIHALSQLLSEGQSLKYLHFFGKFGGLERLRPLIESLADNPHVTYIQLSPEDSRQDEVYLILPAILNAAPYVRQIIISPSSSDPVPLPNEYWNYLCPLIANHPHLDSLICRNVGSMPEEHQEVVRGSGKYISWS